MSEAKHTPVPWIVREAISALLLALEQIATHPVGYGETFDGSPSMGARPVCHECQQKVEIARAAFKKATKS